MARRVPTHTIDSVQQAVALRAPICVQAKVNIDDYISNKYPEAVLIRRATNEDVLFSLKNQECSAAVMPLSEYEQFSRNADINSVCSLYWNGRVEQNIPAGFASDVDSGTLCTSLISHVLDLHFVQLKASGFLEREWEAHLQRTGTHNCVAEMESGGSSEEETFSLGVTEMAGIFIIHAMLLALAILVALLHYYRTRTLRRRRSQRQSSLEMVSKPEQPTGTVEPEHVQSRRTVATDEDTSSGEDHGISSRSIMGGSFEVHV